MKKSLAAIIGLSLLSQGCVSQFIRDEQTKRIKTSYSICGCVAVGVESDRDKMMAQEKTIKAAQRNYFAECRATTFPRILLVGYREDFGGEFEYYAVARDPKCKK